jgi:hypothetical protein
MSFILDALKKLEREKRSAEPEVVMVGPVAWGGRDRRPGSWRLAAAAGVVVAAIAALAWWALGSGDERPTPLPAGTGPGSGHVSLPAPGGQTSPAEAPASQVPPTRPSAPPRREAGGRLPELSPPRPEPPGGPPPSASGPPSPLPALVGPPVSGEEAAAAEPRSTALEDPPVVAEDDTRGPEFRLTAISERDGEPIALLNDRLVREGDRFGDVVVVRIGATEVEIEVKGERRVIGF